MTARTIAQTLQAIDLEDRDALIARWCATHRAPPPKSLSVPFLRAALCYEAQVQDTRGPTAQVLRDLKRQTCGQGRKTQNATSGLTIGSQLLRDWNGRSYRVTVVQNGFEMEGRVWTSLSAVARHITGAHWSGPRFFGMQPRSGTRKKPSKAPRAVADERGPTV